VGREAPRSLLARVAARPEHEVLSMVEEACRGRLLEEAGAHGYRFVHDVIREVVEADLSAARRLLLHRDIALALETDPQEPSREPPIEALAYHYAQTDLHARAAYWLEQAGDHAAAGFANATTLEQYVAARERAEIGGSGTAVLSRLDEKMGNLRVVLGEFAAAREDFARARNGAEEAARRAELWRKEGDVWCSQGEYAQALDAFAAAERQGVGAAPGPVPRGRDATDDARVVVSGSIRASIELSRAEVLHALGDWLAADVAAARAIALLDKESPGVSTDLALARAAELQVRSYYRRGDLPGAEEALRRSIALRERAGHDAENGTAWRLLGEMARDRGDLARAVAHYQQALAIVERIGDQQRVSDCWLGLGHVHYNRGNLAEAEECTTRSLSIAERLGYQRGIGQSWLEHGRVAVKRGQLAAAVAPVARALEVAERLGHQLDIHNSVVLQGHIALGLGDLSGAAGHYERAVEVAAHLAGPDDGPPWGFLGLGHVALARGDLVGAERCYRRALAHLQRVGHGPGRAGALANLGVAACERGAVHEAASWCREARRLAQRMGAADVEALATLGQARVRLRAGRQRRALLLLEHARSMAAAHELAQPVLLATLLRAEVRLAQDAPGEALAAAEDALQQATSHGRPREEALALRIMGECALAQRDHARALHHLRTALAALKERGMTLEAARTRVALARALAADAANLANADDARGLLQEAREAFRTSGAALDLAPAEDLMTAWNPAERGTAADGTMAGAGVAAGRRLTRTARQSWVLEHLRREGAISPRTYAGALGVSVDTALLDLRELVQQGLTRAEGTTKDRRYLLAHERAAR
jgi:tetratricopeptide (TPR) repeat protein